MESWMNILSNMKWMSLNRSAAVFAEVYATEPTSSAQVTMGVLTIVSFVLFLIVIISYFIPAIVANKRNHLQRIPILLLNIFLGWTFIGWIVALIWAVMRENPNTANAVPTATYVPPKGTDSQ